MLAGEVDHEELAPMIEAHKSAPAQAPRPAFTVWVRTARIPTLAATLSPLLVGTAIARYDGTFKVLPFALALVAGLCLQIGANYFNEYFDHRYGLDTAESLGAATVIFRQEMTANQVLAGGVAVFAVATLCGALLIALVGPAIVLFGLAGLAIAYFYSARPFTFARRGLGDPLVFLAMGVLMVWGAYFVQIPRWSWPVFAASIPIGLLVDAILNMNNLRDLPDDAAVGKRTLPVRLGMAGGKRFHGVLVLGSYLAVTVFAFAGLLPLASLAVWLTIPLAIAHLRTILPATDRLHLRAGMPQIARLHLLFGVVLAAAITLAALHR
jgi:1,4-dihydroxy-2-naphthoate octaprenyltransferase